MSASHNAHRLEIVDAGGTWKAEQRSGVTVSVTAQPEHSSIKFINPRTGQELQGHAAGGGPLSMEELRSLLDEAKRLRDHR